MPKEKARTAGPKVKNSLRSTNSVAARLTALEARVMRWEPELDAQFTELARRIEALESKSAHGDTRVHLARIYALERRVAELEAAVKSRDEILKR